MSAALPAGGGRLCGGGVFLGVGVVVGVGWMLTLVGWALSCGCVVDAALAIKGELLCLSLAAAF